MEILLFLDDVLDGTYGYPVFKKPSVRSYESRICPSSDPLLSQSESISEPYLIIHDIYPEEFLTTQLYLYSLGSYFKVNLVAVQNCQEMGELGVPDRFIDAYCGRVPGSVLARHYSDYSPVRLKTIYD